MPEKTDEYYMQLALKEAQAALGEDEVPIGAVTIHAGRVIGRAHNQRERLHDPTAHAEMIAITQAAEYLGRWRLSGCTMYVTIEPCVMCAGAMILARISRLVYGAADPKAGACGSVMSILDDGRFNHVVEVRSGVCADDCAEIMRDFFRQKRAQD